MKAATYGKLLHFSFALGFDKSPSLCYCGNARDIISKYNANLKLQYVTFEIEIQGIICYGSLRDFHKSGSIFSIFKWLHEL